MKSLLLLVIASTPVLPLRSVQASENAIFRSGDELIIQIGGLDVLRQSHSRLDACITLVGDAGERHFTVDMADPVMPGALVVDLKGNGPCRSAAIEIKSADGGAVHTQRVSPVPELPPVSHLPRATSTSAAIERGRAMPASDTPLIALPDTSGLRHETLVPPARIVSANDITYPVFSDSDLPVLGSQNYVIVSRQTAAPDDATRCSLYFSYRKAVCDAATMQVRHWWKFLVEVPLQREWLAQTGDATLTLNDIAVHTTDEQTPAGLRMLGESSGGLMQGGQSAEVDDQGRIYFTNISKGAWLARYNPHTRKFEQPPVDFMKACSRLIPPAAGWTRGWDADLGELLCAHGRVYIVFARNYRVKTPNGSFEVCSGVISVPQEGWNDAAAFGADIRLHAGCWPGAPNALYDGEVPVGEFSRKILAPVATQGGIYFQSAPLHHGGPWRLEFDAKGNVGRLTTGGGPLSTGEVITQNGLTQQRRINVGSSGRQFLRFDYGECVMSRAALALILPGATKEQLVGSDGRYRSTFEGAPSGELKLRFDIAAKIKADATRHGELAAALNGLSQGPAYGITPIPGEADQAIGVCEYGYYFSKLDFSRRATERKVFKRYLPLRSGTTATQLPAQVGLGPYNMMWARHDDALWLYVPGYTGMTRLRYAEKDRPLAAFSTEMFHDRLSPQPVDATSRGGMKDYREIFTTLDGRLIDIGRGRPGRGGTAFSTGLELFDPRTLGQSQTAVFMSRCFDLWTPASRIVLSAAGAPARQEIFAAGSSLRDEYVREITDPALIPASHDPKIFAYDITSGGAFRDLFGFALPDKKPADIVISPCRQFLVILQADGVLLAYHIARRQFVDGMTLKNPAGAPVQPLQFTRPGTTLWAAPDDQIFLHTALDGPGSKQLCFFGIRVSNTGKLSAHPHLAITLDAATRVDDFDRVVRCFMPDLARRDGSYDFILGSSHQKEQTSVRVIEDFILPRPPF